MSEENNQGLVCDQCKVTALKLQIVNRKRVCRFCKKDFTENGKFTRKVIKRDYRAADIYAQEKRKQHNQMRWKNVRRKNRLSERR